MSTSRGKIAFGKIGFSLKSSVTDPSLSLKTTQLKVEKCDHALDKTSTESLKNDEYISESSASEVAGFGSFGRKEPLEQKEQDSDGMQTMMGFSGFGKKARVFDLEEIAEEARKAASEKNRYNLEKMKLNSEEANHLTEDADKRALSLISKKHKDKDDMQNSGDDSESDDDDDFVGPPLPPVVSTKTNDNSDDDENEDDEDDHGYKFPISHELLLTHGTKPITGLAVDSSGSRLVTGSVDYDVKCWDFQGMDLSHEAFRTFCPSDGYPITSVDYSCTGDKFLVAPGSCQSKVYDRDGVELFECAKGDMYLHDMAQTKGHVSSLTSAVWHPKDKEEFLTTARDGTCRLWNVAMPHKSKNVIKTRAVNGLKTHPNVGAYSRDGLIVACVCNDGSVKMWDHRKNFVNTSVLIKTAHEKGTETSGLSFSYDGKGFATRGGDFTLKLWDIRNMKQAIHVTNNLFNRYGVTNCVFSPNDQLVITGTSLEKGETAGKILMFNRNTWKLVREVEIEKTDVIKVIWHTKLNQMIIGCGNGNICLLYDPQLSRNGAVLVAGKHKKKTKQTEVVLSKQVITPHALPMFREERHRSTRKLEERDRKDPVKSHQPELPVGKAGTGGRVASGGSTLSSYIIRNMGMKNKAHEEGDPREALLKFAKEAAENPYWVTPAYSKTQPKPIFQKPADQEEKVDEEEHINKKIKTE